MKQWASQIESCNLIISDLLNNRKWAIIQFFPSESFITSCSMTNRLWVEWHILLQGGLIGCHPVINREWVTLQVAFISSLVSLLQQASDIEVFSDKQSNKQQEVSNTMIFCQAVSSHEQFVSALQCFMHSHHILSHDLQKVSDAILILFHAISSNLLSCMNNNRMWVTL